MKIRSLFPEKNINRFFSCPKLTQFTEEKFMKNNAQTFFQNYPYIVLHIHICFYINFVHYDLCQKLAQFTEEYGHKSFDNLLYNKLILVNN